MHPRRLSRLIAASAGVLVLGLIAGTTTSATAGPLPAADDVSLSPVSRELTPSSSADCQHVMLFGTAITEEELAGLFDDDYAYIRDVVNKCQKAIKPKKIKTKRPKVPKLPGQPSFWMYVSGAQVTADVRRIPGLNDPEICSSFVSSGAFTFESTKPGWAVFAPGPSAGGFGVMSDVQANVVNRVLLGPRGCDTSDATSGSEEAVAKASVSLEGIRLDSFFGGSLCEGRDCPSGWPSLASDGDVVIDFTAKERAQINNKRKGVLVFTASGGSAGGLTSPGECQGWGDGDMAYTCNYAKSWSVTVTLIRADTMDFLPPGQRP